MDDGNMIYITLTKIDKLNKYNAIKDKMDNQIGLIYLDSGDYVELKDNKENITKQDDTSKENNDNVQASSSDNTSDNNKPTTNENVVDDTNMEQNNQNKNESESNEEENSNP